MMSDKNARHLTKYCHFLSTYKIWRGIIVILTCQFVFKRKTLEVINLKLGA